MEAVIYDIQANYSDKEKTKEMYDSLVNDLNELIKDIECDYALGPVAYELKRIIEKVKAC